MEGIKKVCTIVAVLLVASCKPLAPCLKSETVVIIRPTVIGGFTYMLPTYVEQCTERCTMDNPLPQCQAWATKVLDGE